MPEPAGETKGTARRGANARGMTGFLSLPRDFYPAVGGMIDPRRPRGYYIDFQAKGPPIRLGDPDQELHVATAQWGLGGYERHLHGAADGLAIARQAAEVLLDRQLEGGPWDGGLPHHWAFEHTYDLQPPWLSGMAQAEAASLFVRMHLETGEDRFAAAALRALGPLNLERQRGGLRVPLGDGFFCEEYPTDPPSMVLNGGIFALWGYLDVALALDDADARAQFELGLDALARNIGRWDTGSWSLYDLYPHPTPNVASPFYHVLHINQLQAMQRVAPRAELAAAIERFERYQASRSHRIAAFLRKVHFRLRVPRNRFLASRVRLARGVGAGG